MKKMNKPFLMVVIVITSVLLTAAQNKNASVSAYNSLKEKAFSKLDKSQPYRFQGVGVAIEKVNQNGVNVNFSVGVSLDADAVNPLTFTVQPVSVVNQNNESVIKDIGTASKIGSGRIERSSGETEEIVLTPRMIVPITADVNAVKVTISGLETDNQKVYTIILPVDSEIKTAGLGKVTAETESAAIEGKCAWFVGYYSTGCGVRCVGCTDNSPVLNCVQCEMTCANGQTCTPAGPRPADCPG